MILPIQIIIGEMSITLSNSNVFMPGQLLGQFKIAARSAEYDGDEVMPKRVGGDSTAGVLAEGTDDGVGHNIASTDCA